MQLRNATLLVHDMDHSASSRELIHRFQAPYFRLVGEVDDPADALARLDRGTIMALLDIPPRFHEALRAGQPTSVQLQVDTSNAAQGLSASAYAARITARFGLDVAQGMAAGRGAGLPTVESQHRVWFNPDQNERWYQSISHLLRMITMFSILLPAAALVREKERGTVEQLLVSPLSPLQILLSKVLAMTAVILTATAAAYIGVMRPMFHVPMRGSAVLFFLLTTLFVFTTAGLGLFAATVTRNQAQVGLITLLAVGPMLLLSGLTSPFESMPLWVQTLMSLSPLHYYIDVVFGVLLKGSDLSVLWKPVMAMAVLGAAVFALGVWRFRRQFE
jgi:ABC-2 type transport system permease protein